MDGIFRMGELEKIPAPKVINTTKSEILKNFNLPQLEYDYNRFLSLINKYYLKNGINKDLGNLICDCCEVLIKFIDDYPWENPSINNSMKERVKKLSFDLEAARVNYIKYRDLNPVSLRLDIIIAFSFDGALHFLKQYKLLINSFNAGEKLPNNPTDWARKNLFIELVDEHKKNNGDSTFPRHKVIEKAMEKNGYSLPRRTYSDWVRQYKNGSIKHAIQDRKNEQ